MTDPRAGRRAWIREHHPDRGGDPARFAAGLARFDVGPTPPRAVVVGRSTVRRRLRSHWRRAVAVRRRRTHHARVG